MRSVTGAEAFQKGIILPHEHLLLDYGQMSGRTRSVDRVQAQRLIDVLRELGTHGVSAIVDCTPPGYGRHLDVMAEVSRNSGVEVIAATGSFCEQWHGQPLWVQDATVSDLADIFTREIEYGRCGVIKAATSAGAFSSGEHKVYRAAALAHQRTDAPIVSHTTGGLGIEQIDLLEDLGVNLSRVMVSHVCSADEPVTYAVELAHRGAMVGLDRLGHAAHHDDHWIKVLRALIDAGHLDRILLSHDSVQRFDGPSDIAEHTFSDPTYLPRVFLPMLTAAGFDSDVIDRIVRTNPRDWLGIGSHL